MAKSKQNKGYNREKSLPNLKPCKPGQTHNRNGRPRKEICVPDILREIGKRQISDKDKRTQLVAVCEKAFEQAMAGDKDARNFIIDRMEGKAKQQIDISGDNLTPPRIQILFPEGLTESQIEEHISKRIEQGE